MTSLLKGHEDFIISLVGFLHVIAWCEIPKYAEE